MLDATGIDKHASIRAENVEVSIFENIMLRNLLFNLMQKIPK